MTPNLGGHKKESLLGSESSTFSSKLIRADLFFKFRGIGVFTQSAGELL